MIDQPATPRFVGQSIKRKEDRRFLTGHGRYVDDYTMPGMLHAAFLRSPFARATVKAMDTRAAARLPGVFAVYTASDINAGVKPLDYLFESPSSAMPVMTPLVETDIGSVGDPLAVVLAEDRYIAEDAVDLIEVDYDIEEPVLGFPVAADAPVIHSNTKSNLGFSFQTPPDPELDRIFAEAAHIVRKTVAQARVCPSPMETRGLIADGTVSGSLTIRISTQNPHVARRYFSARLGIPEHRLRIVADDVGGGFGQKFHLNRDEVAIASAARLAGRSVKWIEDRGESLTIGGHSRHETLTLELAFDAEARILGARLERVDTAGAFPMLGPEGSSMLIMAFFTGPYKIPRIAARLRSYFTNTGGAVSYRGPWAAETMIRETTIEEAARQLSIDPIELRRRNIIMRSDQPYVMASGMPIADVTPSETLDQALDILDLPAFRRMQEEARRDRRYLGLGTSVYIEPCAISPPMAATDLADIRMEPTGQITATMTVHSQGHSVETTMAQVIADELGVGIDDVTVVFGDTAMIGWGPGAGGSRQAVVGGGAAKQAAGLLRDKLLKLGAHLLQTEPEALRLEGGHVRTGDAVPRSVGFRELAETAYFQPAALPADMEPGLEARSRYPAPSLCLSNATHQCVCEVDVNTGLVKILRWIVSEDCGVMLNPAVVEGQIAGGVVQGIGQVLWENADYDDSGNPVAVTLKDYLLPLSTDIPPIEFGHLCTPSATPTGAKGVGEGGTIVAPAALFNAVADALAPLGARLDALPLTPSRILAAIADGKTQ